ncbi:MAG: hypothetical protein LH660_13900 [Phormidesmis sp. CAN_BIN36]|nr:hypothetical protein [Phormidesmis sp. CAN_BIN36]
MTQAEIEAALQTALRHCETAGCPLNDAQQQILLGVLRRLCDSSTDHSSALNPVAALTPDQRQALFQFIKAQEQQNKSWKTTLLNDWLHDRTSGAVQFIRDSLGLQWLETVTSADLADYEEALWLRVGDRIELSNGLWEWVQDTGPCSREWFSCTVVGIAETQSALYQNGVADSPFSTNCTVRFENGNEYEIQGVYEWNRPNWRWEK